MAKYGFTGEKKVVFGIEFQRIVALASFGSVDKDEVGGWISKEENLDQSGNAWVSGNARVSGDAQVSGDAWVYGNAQVSGDARVSGDADWCLFSSFGSSFRTTTVYRTKDKSIEITCGCFRGTLVQFIAQVKETHEDSIHAKQYLAIVEVIKVRFEISEEVDANDAIS